MLGKLFKSKKTPQNDGELITQSHISNLRLEKVIELELLNMEGNPRYRLQGQLGVGSEIGDIIIDEESISPRHCTFSIEQGVITLIDHNSVAGTKVNDRKVEAGKSIILDENDQVQIGELLIEIKGHNQAVVPEKEAVSISEDKTRESIPIEDDDKSELIAELNKLEDKFQDNTQLGIDNPIEEKRHSDLFAEREIFINEGSQRSIHTLEGFSISDTNEFDLSTLDEVEDEEEDIEALFKKEEKDIFPEKEVKEPVKKKSEKSFFAAKFGRKEKAKKSFRSRSQKAVIINESAANSILRIVALHIDLSFAYGTYLLLSPFDDFKQFIKAVSVKAGEWAALLTSHDLFKTFEQDLLFLVEMFKDIWSLVDSYINPIPTLIIFAISKLIFTLVLGISLGQFLVGIKSSGNIMWKRVGGILRTVIGFMTFPFIIFDLGAIISRRTFKEVVTFTRLYSDSKIFNILMSLIFITVSALFVLMAPMFQGFEASKRYEMSAKVDERIKVQGNGEEVSEVSTIFASNSFGLSVGLTEEFEVFPGFKFEGNAQKTNSQFVLNIFDRKMDGFSQLESFKSFDIKQLLEIGFKGNPFLRIKYPHLDNFIHQHTPVGFKRTSLDSESFSQEFMDFHRMAMDMSLESYFDHIQEMPLVASLLNYKESFLALFDQSEFDQMSFIKMGNVFAIKISGASPKPHDYLIPILSEGKIFKAIFNGEKIAGLSSRLYKYALYQSNWTKDLEPNFFDHIIVALKDQQKISINDAQELYGYYFELAKKVLKGSDEAEYQLLRKALSSVQLLIQSVVKEDQESLLKLESNLDDLVDAVEIRNLEYFSLTDSAIL